MSRPDRLETRVAGVRRRLQLRLAAAAGAASGTAFALVLGLAWLLGDASWWTRPSPLPLILTVLGVLALAGVVVWAVLRLRGLDERAIAASAEAGLGVEAGRLRGVLELGRRVPDGSSSALAGREHAIVAARVASAQDRELDGPLGLTLGRSLRRAGIAAGAALLVVTALGFGGPDRSARAWAALAHPIEHLTPPALPALRVAPGDAAVPRGADLDVAVDAEGRSEVTLHWRARGDVERQRTFSVADGRAAARLERVDAELSYWVTSRDGATTPRYLVTPLDPLLLTDLQIEVRYPAYLGRAPERMQGEVSLLEVPAGTELRLSGRGTRDWTRIGLLDGATGTEVVLQPRGARFEGGWVPDAGGVYDWVMEADGGGAVVAPPALEIRVVTDERPTVELVFPGRDTLLGPSMRQPLVADASDDHGITSAALVSWRVGAHGERDSALVEPIALDGQPDRVVLRTVLAAAARRLLPGDALHYQVRVTDNSPARQTGVSATYMLRLPGMAELRREAVSAGGAAVDDAERLARAAREMERAARELARRGAPAGRPQTSPTGGRQMQGSERRELDFQRAEDARQLLERQEAMVKSVEELRQHIEDMERAFEAAGLRDPEMQRRMEELRALLEEALTPEMRQQLEEMRRSLEDLDSQGMQQALQQLADQQEEFRERLEQTLELMRRAAAEQQMAALAEEAREIAAQQEALSSSIREDGVTEQRTAQQGELADRAEELTGSMQALAQRLSATGEGEAGERTKEAAEQADSAQDAMERAAEQAEAGAQQDAADSGDAGAENMSAAAQSLDQTRQAMTQSWRREVQQAMQQATDEALSMAERQSLLAQEMMAQQQEGDSGGDRNDSPMNSMRGEQSAMQQGLEQMGKNLSEAGQRSAMVSRDVGSSLGRAMRDMQDALEAMRPNREGGARIPAAEAARAAESLNQLAMALLENQERIGNSQAGTGLQQMLEELAELAKQQGGVNSRTNSLLPLDLGERALADQMQQIARQQAEIGRRLGGLNRGQGEEPDGGLSELSEEADRIAQDLAGGRLSPEVMERQQRLFHRLLDAGRSLERDEYTDERIAERPTVVADDAAARMDPRELEGSRRYPLPTEEELRRLPPSYRKLILEYFDRLNRAGSERDGGPR